MGLHGHYRQCFLEGGINLRNHQLAMELQAIREYIRLNESQIVQIRNRVIENERLLQNDETAIFVDFITHDLECSIYNTHFNSLLITLYSILERALFNLCEIMETYSQIKIKDINGNGISKFRRYLELTTDINFAHTNSEWQEITKYNKLRNLIVHSVDNVIDNKKNDLLSILKNIEGLNLRSNETKTYFEITDKKLLINFIKVIDKFMRRLYFTDEPV